MFLPRYPRLSDSTSTTSTAAAEKFSGLSFISSESGGHTMPDDIFNLILLQIVFKDS